MCCSSKYVFYLMFAFAKPACLAVTAGRVFAGPLHSTWSASLCGCERHDLVRWEWWRHGWQPFSGGFGHGRVIGLFDWPRHLAAILFMQRQTQRGRGARILARPQLSDGRRGWIIRSSHAEPLLHSLDAHTRQLDKRLRRCTLWLWSRSSRPRCSPVRRPALMQLHSETWGAQ